MNLPPLLSALAAAGVAAAAIAGSPAAQAGPPALGPGSMVRLGTAVGACTIGFTGHDRQHRPIAVTAGHCTPPGTSLAYPAQSLRPAGHILQVTAVDDLDYTLIALHNPAPNTPIAAPSTTGDRVCKTGAVSGVTCGPILRITPKTVVAQLRVLPGDSGGSLRDSAGRVIGIVSQGDLPSSATAVANLAFYAESLTAPVAAVFPRADKIAERIGYQP